jgi:hypothetical protein
MPGQQIQKGTTYVNYPTVGTNQVTAENLNDHVDNAELLPGAISAQTPGTPEDNDYLLAEQSGSLLKYTLSSIKDLFASYFPLLSGGTMTGELVLANSTPSISNAAASKGYVDSTISTTLSGAIVMWGGSTPPAGWLECNGQSTAGYPNLITVYGTNVPDLRGEFPRGWDHGRGVDSGRAIRSAQAQDVQPHTHSTTIWGGLERRGDGSIVCAASAYTGVTGSFGTTETRPRNVALMFIVKT